MSYILDALNKSEQERRNRSAPGIDTVHRGPPPDSSRAPVWLALIAVVVLLNAGFTYWWMHRDAPVPTSVALSPEKIAPVNARTAYAEPANEVVEARPAPVPVTSAPEPGELITPDQYYQQQSAPDPTGTVGALRVSELPVNIQRAIPDLVFSSHIFADDRSFRMVNINGRLLREGDMLDDEIRLSEVTEEGVTLEFRGYTFEVSVLRDWSFN